MDYMLTAQPYALSSTVLLRLVYSLPTFHFPVGCQNRQLSYSGDYSILDRTVVLIPLPIKRNQKPIKTNYLICSRNNYVRYKNGEFWLNRDR